VIALTLLLLIAAAVLVYLLGVYEERHLEDAFDPQDRHRVGLD
jgi:hypothetical protein